MSNAELARQLGVNKAIVCRDKQRGMPVDSLQAARAWRDVNLATSRRKDSNPARADAGRRRGVKAPAAAGAAGRDYACARTRREAAEADMAEIELAKARGQVLDKESSLRALFTKFRELRDDTAGLGRRVAPVLASLTDAREIRVLLDREVAAIFNAFANRQMQSLADRFSGGPAVLPAGLLTPPSLPE